MNRKRALVALSILLVLSVVVAGFPLADFFRNADPQGADDSSSHVVGPDGSDVVSSPGDVASGDVGPGVEAASPGGPGIPGPLQSATGVEELSRLLKDAGGLLAGRPIATPDLVSEIPTVDPLPAALVKWVAVTGSAVPEDEMSAALADARALPQGVQRDLAKLIFAAAEATLLQRSALAALTPDDIEFLETHPDAAKALLTGRVEDPDAARVLDLSRKVDVAKSTQATLLLLATVEDVRESLKSYVPADEASASAAASSDEIQSLLKPFPGTLDVIEAVAALEGRPLTSQAKLRVAGDLLAAASGVAPAADPRPFQPLDPTALARDDSLVVALAALLGAAHPDVPAEVVQLLAPQFARASALPEDLQDALALVLFARAEAVAGVRVALASEDPVAAVARADSLGALMTLSALEQALPTLEKYALLWSKARPVERAGLAAPDVAYADALRRSAALQGSTASVESAVRSAGATLGLRAGPVARTDLDFAGAFARLARAAGMSPTRAEIDDAGRVAASLHPDARHAATILMLAQVDASDLAKSAFVCLSSSEMRFLRENADPVRAIAASTAPPTAADLALLTRYAELAGCIDGQKLLDATVLLAAAADEARRVLAEATTAGEPVATQSGLVAEAPRGVRGLLARLAGLVPFGTAIAQSTSDPFRCVQVLDSGSPNQDCEIGVIFRAPSSQASIYILDSGSTTLLRGDLTQNAAIFILDLGGDDTYSIATAAVSECVHQFNNLAPILASVHVDIAGNDRYDAPAECVDPADHTRVTTWRGASGAGFTGIGMLVDGEGADYYRAVSHAQGYAWHGAGVLADFGAGGDQYVARYAAQGATYGGFGFSLGLLLDQGGTDRYTVDTRVAGSYQSQAWGLGGFLLDGAGDDRYEPASATPMGLDATSFVTLGGDGRMLASRDDNRVWIDGPKIAGLVQKGVGVDVEADASNPDADLDGMPTVLETLLGSDPNNPGSNFEAAANALTGDERRDSDGDGFPDLVEISLGTDPRDPQEAPAKLPADLARALAPAFRQIFPSNGSAENLTLPDKYLDVRVPFPGKAVHIGSLCDSYTAWSYPATMMSESIVGTANLLSGTGGASVGGPGMTDNVYRAVRGQLVDPLDDVWDAVYFTAASILNPLLPDEGVGSSPLGRFTPDDGSSGTPYGTHGTCNGTHWNSAGGDLVRGGGNTTVHDEGAIFHGGEDDSITVTVPEGLFALGDVVATRYEIDYLATVDLGGPDLYLGRAGGAGGLLLQSKQGHQTAASYLPVGYVALDLDQPGALTANDVYRAPVEKDGSSLAHGSGGGILVDTTGSDRYTAGTDSQGALAGVLLELGGDDWYNATDRSQGASGVPTFVSFDANGDSTKRAHDVARHALGLRPAILLDFEGKDRYKAWNRSQGYARGVLNPQTATQHFGVVAETLGLLVDLAGEDSYRALGRFSQGVARGGASGVVIDAKSNDRFEARDATSQGAIEPAGLRPSTSPSGTQTTDLGGLGAVFDFAGEDAYVVFRDSGVLDRSATRQNNVTFLPVTGANAFAGTGAVHNVHPATKEPFRVVSGAGVHADVEASDRDADGDGTPDFLEAFAGTNWAESSDSPTSRDDQGWVLHLPSARLAIGGRGPQVYERDYAFAVDFGGANEHRANAGGPVVGLPLGDGGSSQVRLLLTAFPVTFTYEVANAPTVYEAPRDLVQGVGYFTVGIVVDEGGADAFTVPRDPRPVFPSRFTSRVPSINGVIDPSEWRSSANLSGARGLAFESRVAPGSERKVEIYVMNDLERLYLALRYKPDELSALGDPTATSDETKFLKNNWAKIAFDTDHDHVAVQPTTVPNDCTDVPERVVAGADGIHVEGWTDPSGRVDTFFNDTWLRAGAMTTDNPPSPDLSKRVWRLDCRSITLDEVSNADVVGRRSFKDGYITIELSKPLSTGDRQDIDVRADGLGGFVVSDLGVQIEIGDRVTQETFAWPPGSARDDGAGEALEDGQFEEELESWATLRLADGDASRSATITQKTSWDLGENATGVPLAGVVGARLSPHGHGRAVTQGAGIGGVGVLAMLGGSRSSAVYAADEFAQGFGAFGGIGLLLDAGGSDRYFGLDFAQGSQALTGVGALIDLEGNDEYVASAWSQGFGFTAKDVLSQNVNPILAPKEDGITFLRESGSAVFIDAGGDDVYRYGQEHLRHTLVAKAFPTSTNVAEIDGLVCPEEAGDEPCSHDVETSFEDARTASLNDRAWTQGGTYTADAGGGVKPVSITTGGVGVDYRAEREFVREVSDLYNELTWNPDVRLVVGREVRTAQGQVNCVTAPSQVIAGITRYAVNGTACVRAFVYFRNYDADAEFYHPVPPGLTVDRLDVLVGDRILARLQGGLGTSASAFGLVVTSDPDAPNEIEYNYPGVAFAVRGWDTTLSDDGAFPLRGQAFYSTTWNSMGLAWLKTTEDSCVSFVCFPPADTGPQAYPHLDGGQETYTPNRVLFMTEESAGVLLDNAPRVVATATPTLAGQAAFSPNAVGLPNSLSVKWAPSHDIVEDRFPLVGYYPSDENVRCPDDASAICHVLPFYMWHDVGPDVCPDCTQPPLLNTYPTSPDASADGLPTPLDSGSLKTWYLNDLGQALEIEPGHTLNLKLFRTAIVEAEYETFVTLRSTSDPTKTFTFSDEVPEAIGIVPSADGFETDEIVQMIADAIQDVLDQAPSVDDVRDPRCKARYPATVPVAGSDMPLRRDPSQGPQPCLVPYDPWDYMFLGNGIEAECNRQGSGLPGICGSGENVGWSTTGTYAANVWNMFRQIRQIYTTGEGRLDVASSRSNAVNQFIRVADQTLCVPTAPPTCTSAHTGIFINDPQGRPGSGGNPQGPWIYAGVPVSGAGTLDIPYRLVRGANACYNTTDFVGCMSTDPMESDGGAPGASGAPGAPAPEGAAAEGGAAEAEGGDSSPDAMGDGWTNISFYVPQKVRFEAGDTVKVELVTRYSGSYLATLEGSLGPVCSLVRSTYENDIRDSSLRPIVYDTLPDYDGPIFDENYIRDQVDANTFGNRQLNDNTRSCPPIVRPNDLDLPEYLLYYGSESYPSRLEFVVRADPATRVPVEAILFGRDDAGNATRDTLFRAAIQSSTERFAGDLEACAQSPVATPCRTLPWTGRVAASGDEVPDGRYILRFSPRTVAATDVPGHPLAGLAKGRVGAPLDVPVLVDATAPVTTFDMPQTDSLKGTMRTVLGRGHLTSGTQFTVKWRTADPGTGAPTFAGSGVNQSAVWLVPSANGSIPDFDAGVWTNLTGDHVPAGRREARYLASGGVTTFYVGVVTRDRVGNVEGLPEGWTHPLCAPARVASAAGQKACIERAFRAAIANMVNISREDANDVDGLFRIDLDLSAPLLVGGEITGPGAHRGLVNGIPRTVVRAGEPVSFRVCTADGAGESGVANVNVYFVSVASEDVEAETRAMSDVGGGCWSYDGWGSENSDKSRFPDGPWAVGFEAFDRGANRVEASLDEIFLDSAAPTVTRAVLKLPEGQVAVKPGDRVDVHLLVEDNTAVNESATFVVAPGLTSAASVGFVRSTLENVTYQATLKVDKPGLVNGVQPIEWSVSDVAGNVVSGVLLVAVDVKDFQIVNGSVKVKHVSYDAITIEWETTEPTAAKVAYGFGPFDLRKSTTITPTYAKKNVVVVKDLQASTRYFLKAVSVSEGGVVHESAVLDAQTLTALYLGAIGLAANDAVSGEHNLTWVGGLRAGLGIPKFSVHVRSGDGPWEFLTAVSQPGANHSVVVNTTRLLDGARYSFRLTAESGRDAVNRTIGPVTVDNTKPVLTLTSSTKASRDAKPKLTGTVVDGLSGVDRAGFTLTIDGKALDPSGFVTTNASVAGEIGFTYAVASPLSLGAHEVVLTARDLAGATTKKAFTLAIDVEAPVLTAAPVAYSPGPSAARRDAVVVLNVTALDASGVESIRANLTDLVASKPVRDLVRVPGTDAWRLEFTVDAPERDGDHGVRLVATDPAGNAESLVVDVAVDTTPPTLTRVAAQDASFTAARVIATANEPVILQVSYTAESSSGTASAESATKDAVVVLTGLLPSRAYTFTATATDGAGNAAVVTGAFSTAKDVKAPSGVTGLRIIDLRDGGIRLEWDAATDDVGIAHYRVYRAGPGEAMSLVAEPKTNWHEEQGLPLERLFTYKVTAVDHGKNEGAASTEAAGKSTTPPRLTGGLVTPTLGSARSTTFLFRVQYVSAGGVDPTYVRVLIDGAPHDMKKVSGDSPVTGLTFEHAAVLGATTLDRPHTYQFEASDGRYVVKFPRDEPVKGPLVSGDSLADRASGLVNFAKQVPLAGAGAALAAVAVAAAVLMLRRRK